MFLVSMNVSNRKPEICRADGIADMGSNVGGSNIAAAKAATLHQEWVSNLGGQYLIGSPAVARGSKKWMDVSLSSILHEFRLIGTGLASCLCWQV
jgi:hypothetical protein